ncbi:malate transporter [Fervidicella metallireducens AeB]|uniref:Malate transporter n=1 Tax=Fervidicella metallireducens AeB TaxID=1403537 RepID=A0A017RS60_9CLOT|nr:AEC family transporter [Fervidicella metallireducens]EYE87563.1 malate transporter [Fervidicella metallireducens AeB]
MIFLQAFESILTIMIMIAIGYILTFKKWFNNETSKLFSKLVTQISLPAMMLSSLMSNFSKDKLLSSGYALTIPFLSMGICFVIAVILSRIIKVPNTRKGAFQSMFFISNTIFIGLPVNIALFGEKSIPYVFLYYIANTTFFWTIGVYNLSKDAGIENDHLFSLNNLKRIFSPPLTSFILAIILILLDIKLPDFIMDTCKYMGNLTTPLSMLFIGITIYSVDIKSIKLSLDMLVILLGRFIVSPFIVYILTTFIPIPTLMRNVFIIQSSLPIMTQTAIIAKAYNADEKYIAIMILITTVLSFLFIPFYMLFLG